MPRPCLICIVNPFLKCCKCLKGYCRPHLRPLLIEDKAEPNTGILARKIRSEECTVKVAWTDVTIHCFCGKYGVSINGILGDMRDSGALHER